MSETPSLNEDFLDMLDALSAEAVEFLIVGAHAMAVHGVPRATGDLDILVRPATENARRALLQNKRATGRAKDLADVSLLEKP